MKIKKGEFEVRILIVGLLLFSMLQSDVIKNNKNPTTLGEGFQSFGSGISEQNGAEFGPRFSEQQNASFRTESDGAGSGISEQNSVEFGSQISELGMGKNDGYSGALWLFRSFKSGLRFLDEDKAGDGGDGGEKVYNDGDWRGNEGQLLGKKITGFFNFIPSVYALTAEEDKQQLEAELANLENQLQTIDNGKWVNISCGLTKVLFNNWNCDNLTGYHTVCISNISYYVSNCNSLVHEEVVNIKSRILEIKEQLNILGEK